MTADRWAATVHGVTDSLHVTIAYADGGDGWIMASIPQVPGAISQGRTREQARANVLDALALMLTADRDMDPAAERESVELLIAS